MKKPESTEKFIELIKSMKHRERFVFSIKDNSEMEIYTTLTKEGYGDMNLCLTIVDINGKGKPSNRLVKLISNNVFNSIYNMIN